MNHRSVRVRLSVWLALIVSAIIVALGVLSHQIRKAELQQKYLVERETIKDRLTINLANPVWNWDVPTVELNIRAELSGSVVGISVSQKPADTPIAQAWVDASKRFKEQEEVTVFPLTLKADHGEPAIGYVTLTTSRHAMQVALQDLILQRVGELMALLVLVLLAFWWTFLRLVLKPLEKLNAVLVNASEVQSSDFTLALPVHSDDEFGAVVKTVDKIQQRLRADLMRAELAQAEARNLYADQVTLTAQLEESRQLAEESSRSKGEFLANMSHEIRTPMNAIIGLSGLALRLDMSDRLQDYLKKIKSSGEHLLGIINDILDFSKIESGKMEIEKIPFEINTVIENLINLVNDKAESKGLELICNVSPAIPCVLVGDALRIGQILVNLANNAIKFTEQGEVRIHLEIREHHENQAELYCAVQDTGIGLKPEQIGRLFQSFSQADASITRKYGGTGLGLTISKSLAEGMGGEIGVNSTFGAGSTFWFTARVGIGSQEPLIAPSSIDLHGSRILVVDDSEAAALTLTHMLEAIGFVAQAVHTGALALEAVQTADVAQRPYTIVLLDWRMPGLDGLQTAQAIQTLPLKHQPKLLMLSAHLKDEWALNKADTGIEQFLSKPVTPSLLLNAMMQAVGHSSMPQQSAALHMPSEVLDATLHTIAGARVLLVEDNEINQQVATELLTSAGCLVEVADNGQIGVAQVQGRVADGTPYDIVLMDMQMPVMDGVTACRLIRETLSAERLPIVAMTANAMKADSDRCLNAGMNAVVTKPINPDDLWRALLHWIKPRPGLGRLPQPTPTVIAEPSNEARTLGQAVVEGLQGIEGLNVQDGLLRTGNNPDFYIQMLRKMVSTQADSIARIRQCLAEGDTTTAERLAHTLKGVAGNLGADVAYSARSRT